MTKKPDPKPAPFGKLLKESIPLIYNITYPPTGWDPLTQKFHDKDNDSKFLNSKLTRGTSFFGLPNHRDTNQQNLKNIGRNLLGWQENKSTNKNRFNYVKTIYAAPKNLLIASMTTIQSIAKLFTEFLPFILIIFCKELLDAANAKAVEEKNAYLKFFYQTCVFIAASFGLLFQLTYMIGRAITSPIEAVRNAFETGHLLLPGNKTGGRILGIALSLLSIAITATVYAFLFTLIPVIFDPTLIAPAFEGMMAALDITLTSAFGIIGAAAGITIATLGTLASMHVITPLNRRWQISGQKSPAIESGYESLPRSESRQSTWYGLKAYFKKNPAEQTAAPLILDISSRLTSLATPIADNHQQEASEEEYINRIELEKGNGSEYVSFKYVY